LKNSLPVATPSPLAMASMEAFMRVEASASSTPREFMTKSLARTAVTPPETGSAPFTAMHPESRARPYSRHCSGSISAMR